MTGQLSPIQRFLQKLPFVSGAKDEEDLVQVALRFSEICGIDDLTEDTVSQFYWKFDADELRKTTHQLEGYETDMHAMFRIFGIEDHPGLQRMFRRNIWFHPTDTRDGRDTFENYLNLSERVESARAYFLQFVADNNLDFPEDILNRHILFGALQSPEELERVLSKTERGTLTRNRLPRRLFLFRHDVKILVRFLLDLELDSLFEQNVVKAILDVKPEKYAETAEKIISTVLLVADDPNQRLALLTLFDADGSDTLLSKILTDLAKGKDLREILFKDNTPSASQRLAEHFRASRREKRKTAAAEAAAAREARAAAKPAKEPFDPAPLLQRANDKIADLKSKIDEQKEEASNFSSEIEALKASCEEYFKILKMEVAELEKPIETFRTAARKVGAAPKAIQAVFERQGYNYETLIQTPSVPELQNSQNPNLQEQAERKVRFLLNGLPAGIEAALAELDPETDADDVRTSLETSLQTIRQQETELLALYRQALELKSEHQAYKDWETGLLATDSLIDQQRRWLQKATDIAHNPEPP